MLTREGIDNTDYTLSGTQQKQYTSLALRFPGLCVYLCYVDL